MENEETIMDVDVNNLKQKQYEFLKNNTIRKLNEIIRLLQNGNLQAVMYSLKFSGAGDGYGQDNYYIDFSYDKQPRDLQEIIEKMAELKGIELENIE